MCGFLNVFGDWSSIEKKLKNSLSEMNHRGPDDQDIKCGDDYWMGFCRLAIQDLSLKGRQPMEFENGRYILTFNGEIYNFKELREDLKNVFNCKFKSGTDTEVLGILLIKYGVEKTLNELRGMFSFTFFDKSRKKVVVARDNFGIKPLYYYIDNDYTILSSEFRAIYKLGLGDVKISDNRLGEYFYLGSIGSPETLSDKIKSFSPSQYAIIDLESKQFQLDKFWELEWSEEKNDDQENMQNQVYQDVMSSVKSHMISDVPVGLFLSGGLDSSILCACMKELGVKVKAFSIGWDSSDGVVDESQISKKTAEFYDVDFHFETLNSDFVYSNYDKYIGNLDLPTGDGLNTYLVSQLAAKHVKVVLNGAGADEIVSGYGFHRMFYLANKLKLYKCTPKVIENVLFNFYMMFSQEIRSKPLSRAIAMSLGTFGSSVIQINNTCRMIFSIKEIEKMLNKSFSEYDCVNSFKNNYKNISEKLSCGDKIDEMLLYENRGYLVNTLLRDSDNMSMANSLELRVPFVDKELFKTFARCPSRYKVNANQGKMILRNAFKKSLPEHITRDTRKKGFNLPMMKWLREKKWKDLVYDTLNTQNANIYSFCARKELLKHLENYYLSSNNTKLAYVNYQKVWLSLILESWLKKMS